MRRLPGFVLKADAWLTALLGRPAYRLVTDRDGEAALPEGAFFATAKVAAEEVAIVEELETRGFHVIDIALNFVAPAQAISREGRGDVRPAGPQDRRAVATIARDGFRFSRFHLDPRIPPSLAGKIKAAWAENFFSGQRGDAMIVAEVEGEVAGFLQLLNGPAKRLIIDLIAVDARFRGRGLARAMIGRAASSLGATELAVGTQAANAVSIRLYEGLGLRHSSAQFVLHHHGSGGVYAA